MKPPAFVHVGGLTYSLEFPDELEGDNSMGRCDPRTQTIQILGTLPDDGRKQTVIHEILHAIWAAYGVQKGGEERMAYQLEGPLLMLIRDNPKLVRWLAD